MKDKNAKIQTVVIIGVAWLMALAMVFLIFEKIKWLFHR
jgi:hypothetical protein